MNKIDIIIEEAKKIVQNTKKKYTQLREVYFYK